MSDFALYGSGLLANGAAWSSRIYVSGSVSEAAGAAAIHSAWDALWGQITTYLPVATTLTETACFTLNSSWKFTTGTTNDESLAGTSGVDSLPISTAAVITWRTAQRTKSGHGRSFLPASAINSVATAADTGKLLPAFQTAASTGAADFLSALTGAALTPLLLKRSGLTTTPITGANVGSLFRQQRRRQSKVSPTYV